MKRAILLAALVTAMTSACVSMPDFDSVEGTPEEFKDELANIRGYPDARSTPSAPTDVPTAAQFDRRANALLARSGDTTPQDYAAAVTPAELAAVQKLLMSMVNAYKLDDPK